MADNAKWYVAHTYSGYENAVKAAIEKSVVNRGMEDMVLKTEIPMETVTEVTETGVMKEVQRKVFPGYVLIKMVMTDDTWHLIRNIRGVTGFVGEANKAIPLTEDEVAALGMEKREIVVLYHVGDTVRITEGPLSPVPWRRSSRRRTGCAWSYPCSDARPPLISNWTRSRSAATERRTSARKSGAGVPAKWERRCASRQKRQVSPPLPHFIEGGAYKWHRK